MIPINVISKVICSYFINLYSLFLFFFFFRSGNLPAVEQLVSLREEEDPHLDAWLDARIVKRYILICELRLGDNRGY